MPVNKKVLFVTHSLQKAGSEKYLYELVTNMDKDKFDIEILVSYDAPRNKEYPHYYYFKLKERNFKIHTLLYSYERFKTNKKIITNLYKKIEKLFRIKGIYYHFFYKWKMSNLLKKNDAVILIDALYYNKIKNFITDEVYFETHLMCHQAQFDKDFNIYSEYDKSKDYNFVYIDEKQILEIESKNIKYKNLYHFPLSIDIEKLNSKQDIAIGNIHDGITIGIFTRINRIKPIDKLIVAFKHFNQLCPESKLKIFGKIQEEDYYFELINKIKSMNLEDNILFMGHVDDMIASVKKENVNLVWVLSIFQFVGYAGVELCLNNVPIILNNIDGDSKKELDNSNSIPPYFYDEIKLANYTYDIIREDKLGELLSVEKQEYIIKNNLKINISKYENYLETILS